MSILLKLGKLILSSPNMLKLLLKKNGVQLLQSLKKIMNTITKNLEKFKKKRNKKKNFKKIRKKTKNKNIEELD